MLCWGAGGASEPIPCSQLVENLSLEPTWRTAAVCWSRMCCAACLEQVLPEPGGICWVVTALGQGDEQGCVCLQYLCSL